MDVALVRQLVYRTALNRVLAHLALDGGANKIGAIATGGAFFWRK